jgi:alkanesulfonate monooxygenase SsuD/methylene tetrahydromethanopterin reductase-like flavin-dependent oxidoreductase (luciferase family)
LAVLIDVLLDPFDATWADVRAAATQAEASGFDGVWLWDHLAGSVHGAQRVLECWTTLSGLAASTTRLSLGPMVLNVANRDPGVLAVMAATLQEMSGSRVLLGIGAGGGRRTPYAAEQYALGRSVAGDIVRRRAVDEAVGTLRRIWRGQAEPASGFLRPDPPPPIVIGAFGPKMAALAGRIGDGISTQAGHPRLGELLSIARDAHGEADREGAFVSTVFTGLDSRWLRPDSQPRQRLDSLGIDRLVLIVDPPYVADLAEAGRLLRGVR